MPRANPANSAPSISVLIPAFNEEALIAKTIESVQKSFAEVGHERFEIIVCDNNSTDRTADVARAKGARVVFEPHNQIARARNTAARHAIHEWLIFLDADKVHNSRYLEWALTLSRPGALIIADNIVRHGRTYQTPPPDASAAGAAAYTHAILQHPRLVSVALLNDDMYNGIDGFSISLVA